MVRFIIIHVLLISVLALLADNVGAIAGSSLGSLFVVVLVVVVLIVLVKKTKSEGKKLFHVIKN